MKMGILRDKISIPFLIGSGFKASLYRVTFPYAADKYRPNVSCVLCQCDLLNIKERIEVFVTYVKLVGSMKRLWVGVSHNKLAARMKFKTAYPNILSFPKNHKNIAADDSSVTVQEVDHKKQERSPEHSEIDAKAAIVKACPSASQLYRPWPSIFRLCSGSEPE